jgi:predicted DNA-binding protein (UPF0278 family)
MEHPGFNYKDISAIVCYLGECTYHELSYFIKEPEEKVFAELERLVRKEKLESKTICGELVYRFIGD